MHELATRKDQCIVVANGRLSVPLAYQDLQEIIISAVFYVWDEIFENNWQIDQKGTFEFLPSEKVTVRI